MNTEEEKEFQRIKQAIAAQVRSARAFCDKTQKEIAGAAGISVRELSLIERGKANARLATVGKILAVMGFRLALGAVPWEKKEEVKHG